VRAAARPRWSKEDLLKKSAGTRIGLVLAAITVSLIVSLIVPIEIQTILIHENGPIEWLTVALYAVALGYILLKGVYQPLKWPFWLTVLLLLRELDFDSRFTDAKITKSGFLFGADVPILQKIYGFTLLAIVAFVVFKVVATHAAAFLRELRAGTDLALAVLLTVMAAGLSKLVDGGRRKLGYVGVELTEQQVTGLQLFEEIVELSIPLLIMVAISFFLRRYRRGEWR
jgi:hypothetical protein